MTSLRERFDTAFAARATAFKAAVADLDTTGIPEPHLPLWGSGYESAPLKIGIVGRDTRSWGSMQDFFAQISQDPVSAVHRYDHIFEDLTFTEWTNNFGKTFFDTAMKLVSGIQGLPDWRALKRRQDLIALRSFLWANANSVETYEASPKVNGVNPETWRKVKTAAEECFDSLNLLLETFRPHVLVILNWNPGEHFMDLKLNWETFGDHQSMAYHKPTGTHLFATAHPTWLNQKHLYDTAIGGIIAKAKETVASIPIPALT